MFAPLYSQSLKLVSKCVYIFVYNVQEGTFVCNAKPLKYIYEVHHSNKRRYKLDKVRATEDFQLLNFSISDSLNLGQATKITLLT